MADGNHEVMNCKEWGKMLVGNYEGVRIIISLDKVVEVATMFPAWVQN